MKRVLFLLLLIPQVVQAQYSYDGTDDAHVIAGPDVGAATGTTDCGFFRPSALSFGETLLSYGNGKDSATGRGWAIIHFTSGGLRVVGLDGNDVYNEDFASALAVDTDVHICLAIGATLGDAAIYINGVQSGSDFYIGGIAQSSADAYHIGKPMANLSFGHAFFPGKAAHVARWTVRLTGVQIASLADKSTCPADVESANLEIFVPLTDSPATDQGPNTFTVTTESAPSLTTGFTGLPACSGGGSPNILPILTEIWGY